jgi:hypothetical protein
MVVGQVARAFTKDLSGSRGATRNIEASSRIAQVQFYQPLV